MSLRHKRLRRRHKLDAIYRAGIQAALTTDTLAYDHGVGKIARSYDRIYRANCQAARTSHALSLLNKSNGESIHLVPLIPRALLYFERSLQIH